MHVLLEGQRGGAGHPGEYPCAELFRCTRAPRGSHSPRTKNETYSYHPVLSVGHVPPTQQKQYTDVVAIRMVPVPPFLMLKQDGHTLSLSTKAWDFMQRFGGL